jgi:hypothetical protein
VNKTQSRPTFEIEVNDVWYLYVVGITYIAITTKPDPDVWPLLPDHMKVSFAIEAPSGGGVLDPDYMIKSAVVKAIRAKVAEQKKSGNFPRNLPTPQPKEKKARTKKEIER